MTRLEIQIRIKALREELESRHKLGIAKFADNEGKPIPTEVLQKSLYSLIYKLSKFE